MTSIILYQVLNSSGTLTNQWLSTDNGADYYEPCFGMLAWTEQVPIIDADGNPVLDADNLPTFTQVEHPATFSVKAMDVTYEHALAECHRQRAEAYPPVSEFADAMVHSTMGDSSYLQAYYQRCEDVKQRFPKPTPPANP